jgi:agmatinase
MNTTTEATSRFFGVAEEFASAENSKVSIVPVPYHSGGHTDPACQAEAPQAVLAASQNIELFDEELWTEPYKVGIHTAESVNMEPVAADAAEPFAELREAVAPLIEFDKFPILVGGNHAITLGAVKACVDRYPDLSVFQIDARANCHQTFNGNPYSHECVSYQIYQALPEKNITQVGVRSISQEEVQWMENEKPGISIFWARNQDRWNIHEIINSLSENVYLSIDLCGLDPSIMPATCDPQPGGLSWYLLMDLIKQVSIKKNVVAADVTGLKPRDDMPAATLLTAKLMYKLIGYRFALDLGVSKKYL